MYIQYVRATSELTAAFKACSGTNASDFIQFDDNYLSLIALAEDQPIALIVAKTRPLAEPLQMLTEAFIDIIEVLPEYQRQGVGTALVQRVIQWAQERRVSQVRAWSEEIRCEALLLWNKLGFTFSRVDFQNGPDKRYGFYVARRL
jgi:GNAT superfamily N-acetyltransferase